MPVSSPYCAQQRKQRWMDFMKMNGSTDFVYLVNLPNEKPPSPWPDKKSERIEWAWRKYNNMTERMSWLRDDSIPFLDIFTGTEVFAEAFGCNVHRPEDNMPFALPLVYNAAEAAKVRIPSLWDSSLVQLFEIADALRSRAGTDALVRLPDIQSPMDIAALIWDKNDFYMAMIDEPEAVKELAHKVRELLTSFLDQWFKRYGYDYIAHYPDYFMHEGLTLSEDEIGIVSEKQFLEFYLPELVDLAARYGGIGIHCCAGAEHQWEHILKIPGLRLLNLSRPEGIIEKAYGFFAKHVAQMHSGTGDNPTGLLRSLPPGTHAVIQVPATDRDQARRISDELSEACGRNPTPGNEVDS